MILPSPFLSADPLTADDAPDAFDWNSGASGDVDLIAEIFVGADKLDEHRFVLDEEAFMAAVEDVPLFMRRVG
jgi:hypothetical protein